MINKRHFFQRHFIFNDKRIIYVADNCEISHENPLSFLLARIVSKTMSLKKKKK